MSASTMIGIVASIDAEQVRQRLGGAVPARTIGAILTLAQDASGAMVTALAGGAIQPQRPVAPSIAGAHG